MFFGNGKNIMIPAGYSVFIRFDDRIVFLPEKRWTFNACCNDSVGCMATHQRENVGRIDRQDKHQVCRTTGFREQAKG
jgi:hypothetical protein